MGAGIAIGLIGSAVSAAGSIATGEAEQAEANYQAEVDQMNAKAAQAAAQRQVMQTQDQEKLAQSTLQAGASAGGFTGTDPTALSLTGQIAQKAAYDEAYQTYGGDNEAQGDIDQATGAIASGQAAMEGAEFGAAGTILGGFSNALWENYGKANFPKQVNPRWGSIFENG